MAEIDVQERERPVWPWVAGLAAIILVIAIVVVVTDGDRPVAGVTATEERAPTNGDAARLPAMVVTYIQHVESLVDSDVIQTFEHDYVAGALRLLPDAIEAVAIGPDDAATAGTVTSVGPGVTELRQRARSIPEDYLTLDHTVHVYEAFVVATQLLTDLRAQRDDQRADAAERHIAEMRAALGAVSTAHLIQPQRDTILRWLNASAEALRELAAH